MIKQIPNSELNQNDLPLPDAKWEDIQEFALSFNGYEYWGSFGKCADIANKIAEEYEQTKRLHCSLTGLRTCLFFEQRRWRHFGYAPDEDSMKHIHALIEEIGNKIANEELD